MQTPHKKASFLCIQNESSVCIIGTKFNSFRMRAGLRLVSPILFPAHEQDLVVLREKKVSDLGTSGLHPFFLQIM